LPARFRCDGFDYRQIAREGDAAIYEQIWSGCLNPSVCYEVIRIRRRDGFEIGDRFVEAAEVYPNSEAWGVDGWTVQHKDAAFLRLQEIRTSHKKESANPVKKSPIQNPDRCSGSVELRGDVNHRRDEWSEVDLARGHIEVKAAKAKSARRRLVPIQANLAAWLRVYSGSVGLVVPDGARGKLDRVREAACLARWPKNGLRHSFASYRLAAIHDAPRVGSELGHTTPQLLYSTYRELVRPEEAERYWQIMPASAAENLVAFVSA